MTPSTSLLLLPAPPTEIDATTIYAAYRLPIEAVVSALGRLPHTTTLQVVLPCPALQSRLSRPRSELWSDAQHLLANIYSLICVVCAKLAVDVDCGTPGSIDARVLLLDYDGTRVVSQGKATLDNGTMGPIIDLPTFALTRRHWRTIYNVDGEEGQHLLAAYTGLASEKLPPLNGNLYRVGGGVIMRNNTPAPVQASSNTSMSHRVVAVGGTFDHLHAGHKLLLTATALLLQPHDDTLRIPLRLIVGITGDQLLKNKKHAEYLSSWKQRQDDVVDFLVSVLSFTRLGREKELEIQEVNEPVPNGKGIFTKLNSCSVTIECVEIQDPFGPTITDESVTALVVSGETKSGGQAVNEKRAEKGWRALEVFEVDVLRATEEDSGHSETSFESKISSSAIRQRIAETSRGSSL
ncbi:Nucleotidylyl transferase [Glarea lozoyensis ATCC 20868]|uniref:Nucleotidylyl transferase n=1 Tax=Glarea lozoyensis (strain ATCC 20868 / MF5171) TaxID=1116229 RepID=S3DU97_GLAL2|nr:Nucleotidylyl transferase [Glarea lozoyensis ATCC 20868]EPE35536.1 Nucleotidylyl transferase [Glarea lozoyensis ATCC 20868]